MTSSTRPVSNPRAMARLRTLMSFFMVVGLSFGCRSAPESTIATSGADTTEATPGAVVGSATALPEEALRLTSDVTEARNSAEAAEVWEKLAPEQRESVDRETYIRCWDDPPIPLEVEIVVLPQGARRTGVRES